MVLCIQFSNLFTVTRHTFRAYLRGLVSREKQMWSCAVSHGSCPMCIFAKQECVLDRRLFLTFNCFSKEKVILQAILFTAQIFIHRAQPVYISYCSSPFRHPILIGTPIFIGAEATVPNLCRKHIMSRFHCYQLGTLHNLNPNHGIEGDQP